MVESHELGGWDTNFRNRWRRSVGLGSGEKVGLRRCTNGRLWAIDKVNKVNESLG
jgi:hypothetical protein